MVPATATDMSSTDKAILNKITGSRSTGREASSHRRTDTDGQMTDTRPDTRKLTARRTGSMIREVNNVQVEEDMRSKLMDVDMHLTAMPVGTTTITVRRIDNTILGTNNDQTEVDNHPRTVLTREGRHQLQIKITEMEQDLKDNRHRRIKTTEVSHLSLKDTTRGMATLSNGQATRAKLQIGTNRTREMATGSKEISEIGQRNDHLRRNRMAALVRDSHRQKNPRRVQWRSGKRKRRRDYTKLPTNQK